MRFLLLALPFVIVAVSACNTGGNDTEPLAPAATEIQGRSAPTKPAVAPTATVAARTSDAPSTAAGPTEHEGKRTIAHIEKLAGEIGARVSGTRGETLAAEYIAAQFRTSGYSVEIVPFEFEDNPFRAGTVKLGAAEISAMVMSGSGTGSVSGKAIYVGLADEAGIARQDLKGAIAIADRGTLNFSVKYTNVKAAGAIGLIVLNNTDGLFPGNLTRIADFPVVGVAGEDRERFRKAATDRISISVDVAAKSTAVNVVARPFAGAQCDIVVGGHHDTVPGVPGATDNASGAAMTIELARALAADGLDKGVCFVTFGGEESGLNGSQAFVERARAKGGLPRYMINLDVVATGKTIELIGDRELQVRAEAIGAKQGAPVRLASEPANSSSDHASFRSAGVPAIFLAGDDYSMIHTPGDNLTVVVPSTVEAIGDLALALIKELELQVARG